MNHHFIFCTVCKKNKAVKESYCKDCLKVVTTDLMHLIDKDSQKLEGTVEQQKHTWNLYIQQYGDLKEQFIKSP